MGSVCALKGTPFGPAAAERPRDSRIGRRTRWAASRAGREGWARAATMGRGFGVSTAFQAQRDRVDECGIVAHAKERRVHEHLRAAARSAKPMRRVALPGGSGAPPGSPHRESPRPFPNQHRVSCTATTAETGQRRAGQRRAVPLQQPQRNRANRRCDATVEAARRCLRCLPPAVRALRCRCAQSSDLHESGRPSTIVSGSTGVFSDLNTRKNLMRACGRARVRAVRCACRQARAQV